jgi:hypothetical protein
VITVPGSLAHYISSTVKSKEYIFNGKYKILFGKMKKGQNDGFGIFSEVKFTKLFTIFSQSFFKDGETVLEFTMTGVFLS